MKTIIQSNSRPLGHALSTLLVGIAALWATPTALCSAIIFSMRTILLCLLRTVQRLAYPVAGVLSFLLFAASAQASFHLMQIDEILTGVNGDTSAQAIDLRMRAAGQNFLNTDAGGGHGPAQLVALDAHGLNPVELISFPHDLTNGSLGDEVLITTSSFAKYESGPLTPDFIFTNAIPASYLQAGQIDYEAGNGGVLWSISFGGSGYTGTIPAASANGGYGSPFAGSLPSGSESALLFHGPASAASSDNSTEYALTSGPAVFTNNAGQSITVVPEPNSIALAAVGLLAVLGLPKRPITEGDSITIAQIFRPLGNRGRRSGK